MQYTVYIISHLYTFIQHCNVVKLPSQQKKTKEEELHGDTWGEKVHVYSAAAAEAEREERKQKKR